MFYTFLEFFYYVNSEEYFRFAPWTLNSEQVLFKGNATE
jgi:hypothetical protein